MSCFFHCSNGIHSFPHALDRVYKQGQNYLNSLQCKNSCPKAGFSFERPSAFSQRSVILSHILAYSKHLHKQTHTLNSAAKADFTQMTTTINDVIIFTFLYCVLPKISTQHHPDTFITLGTLLWGLQ